MPLNRTFRTMARIERSSLFDVDQDYTANAARLRRVIVDRIELLVECIAYNLIHLDARRYRIMRTEFMYEDISQCYDLLITVNYTDTPLVDKSLPAN